MSQVRSSRVYSSLNRSCVTYRMIRGKLITLSVTLTVVITNRILVLELSVK